MQPRRDLAIVLRSVLYEERHRIITAITLKSGLVSALAKNSVQSRRFGGSLELFSASDWLFSSKPGDELYFLSEAQIREPFENLRKDFTLMSIACALNEILLKVAPPHASQIDCSDLFRLHSNALAALNRFAGSLRSDTPPPSSQQKSSEIAFLNIYLGKLLQWNGNQPQLQGCLECQIPLSQLAPESKLQCIVPAAGWICPQCRPKNQRSPDTLWLDSTGTQEFQFNLSVPIRQFFAPKPDDIHPKNFETERKNQQALFLFLEALFRFHLPGFDEKFLKSLRFADL